MILPTVAAVSQDALRLVPYKVKEAAYGLGTTRWEAILRVMVPAAATGIFGALVLGFGRALGETMALAMLIGNSNQMSLSLFSPGQHAGRPARPELPRGRASARCEVLMYAALVLLAITLVVNVIGEAIMTRRLEEGEPARERAHPGDGSGVALELPSLQRSALESAVAHAACC